jgi:hypothetical protein
LLRLSFATRIPPHVSAEHAFDLSGRHTTR